MIKVSVIIAIYNVAPYLEKCIQSVISQTYRNIEIILVNDGSKDDCLSICQRFAAQDDRIKVLDQENQGVSAARNNGIENAEGDYLMFVDGDDCLKENIVEELVANAENNDITICSYNAFDDSSSVSEDCHFYNGDRDFTDDKTDLYLQLINLSYGREGKCYTAVGVPWGKLYSRHFIEKYNLCFDRKLIRMQDNIFNMRAFALAKSVKYIDKPLYMYRLNNILTYKKLPYKPEILIDILHEREKIINEFCLDRVSLITDFFGEEVLLSALKIKIYIARTEKLAKFKSKVLSYLSDDIYVRYKDKGINVSKRSRIIHIYTKMGLNAVTYLIAKYIKY